MAISDDNSPALQSMTTPTFRERIIKKARSTGTILAGLFLISLGIETVIDTPPHAVMYVHRKTGHYVSPPCLKELELERGDYRMTTRAELHKIWEEDTAAGRVADKARRVFPDKRCSQMSGHSQEGRSLGGLILERVGLLWPLHSRWDEDGNWRW